MHIVWNIREKEGAAGEATTWYHLGNLLLRTSTGMHAVPGNEIFLHTYIHRYIINENTNLMGLEHETTMKTSIRFA